MTTTKRATSLADAAVITGMSREETAAFLRGRIRRLTNHLGAIQFELREAKEQLAALSTDSDAE